MAGLIEPTSQLFGGKVILSGGLCALCAGLDVDDLESPSPSLQQLGRDLQLTRE